jgi:hypothetical protein
MDEIEVPADHFREGVFGPVPGVAGEQFPIGVAHVQKDNVARLRNPPNFLATSGITGLSRLGFPIARWRKDG